MIEFTPKIGDRIVCQDDYGTIRYIGEVDDYVGVWFGIDWDDAQRGKHNGSVKDKQYFIAKSTKSGSFVRPEKVELGQSLLTAITSRYGQKDVNMSKYEQQMLLKSQKDFNAPFLEMVGFNKVSDIQSDYNNLKILMVRLQKVRCIGEKYELKKLLPNIEELDISKNLISSWEDIYQICEEFEHLHWLNVGENYLELPENYKDYNFPNMKTLIVGGMDLTWNKLLEITTVFPNLEEIIAPNNNFTNLDINDNYLMNLLALDIDTNPIENWSEVNKLGLLPKLEVLNVENCNINEIRVESNLFKNLKFLVIKQNLINDWESVGELNKLENFNSLKFSHNPLFEQESNNSCHQFIIAKILKLESLNGRKIKEDERKGAEYDYLKKYGLEWLKVKNTDLQNDFVRRHNRYLELIEKHGELEESELRIISKTIITSLTEVLLIHEDKIIKKKLPPSILIQKLIMLAQRLFNLDDRPNLVYTSGEIEIDLDDECKELGFYSIEDGDKIIVKTYA